MNAPAKILYVLRVTQEYTESLELTYSFDRGEISGEVAARLRLIHEAMRDTLAGQVQVVITFNCGRPWRPPGVYEWTIVATAKVPRFEAEARKAWRRRMDQIVRSVLLLTDREVLKENEAAEEFHATLAAANRYPR